MPPETPWLSDPAARAVCTAIQAEGHHLYFVGGCVRNVLLGRPGSDVDMSTDALPQQVIDLAPRRDHARDLDQLEEGARQDGGPLRNLPVRR